MGLLINHSLHYEKFPDGTVKCIEDEIPFELPEGWEWTRLESVFKLSSGKAIKVRQLEDDGEYPVYGGNGINGLYSMYNVESETIIIGRVGFYCGSVYKTTSKAWVTDNALIASITEPSFYQIDFLCNLLKYLDLGKTSVSTAQPVVSGKGIYPLLVPIPPLDEQKRIVTKLNDCVSIVDVLESDKSDLQTIIQLTKSKILDLAIRGKLVPQNPDDEPASVLLERIKAEKEELIKQGKIKRDKKESVIYKGDDNSYYEKIGDTVTCIDDELPFELPDVWTWCRGASCFLPMESRKPSGSYFKYIDIDSIDNKHQAIREAKITETAKAPSRASRAVFDGSILFSLVRPYLKNIALVDSSNADSIASTGFYIATSNGVFIPKYLYILMISAYVVDGLNQFMKGDNSPSINKDNIEKWFYPVPPLAEQKRIADSVQEYISILEDIEKSLS